MKKFEIEYKGHLTVEANDKHEADRIFSEQYQKFGDPISFTEIDTENGITSVGESHEVIGYCEISGKSIFEDDEYLVDNEDGIMVLKSENEK